MGIKILNIIKIITVTCLLAGLMALALCIYQSSAIFDCNISNMSQDNFGISRFGTFFIIIEAAILFCVIAGNDCLFRYRYLIAISLFIVCVTMEITGSSIGCFVGAEEKNLLLGVSRGIRSDEWAILTPMTWSQYYDPNGKFSYFSSIIRAEATDVFIEYGLPIKTPLMIYKPFLLGYLFLPVAKGMAFFWCGRLIVLAMVSFEFGRFVTRDSRLLALVYSVMIVFSPVVQWWFAINGLVEMLIFFQLSILCFDRYLKDCNSWRRLLYVIVIGICAGGYALTMYPAWMIPLAYVLLGCIIWVYYGCQKNNELKKLGIMDVLSIFFVVGILCLSAMHIYSNSHETITTIINTEYPGHRFENGGDSSLMHLFSFIPSIWYAVRESRGGTHGNVCECAYFISLFPAGYLLFLHRLVKKKIDALCVIMTIISILLVTYCVLGFPEIIATMSLLKYSKANRALVAWGYANVILLVRIIALSFEDKGDTKHYKDNADVVTTRVAPYLFMGVVAVLGIWVSYKVNTAYYNKYMIVIEALLYLPLYCLVCNSSKYRTVSWSVLMIVVCLISGALVNPVRRGVDDININSDVQMIREIVEKDPEAVWLVEGDSFPTTNLPLLAGARTINCSNIYPDLERWRRFDPKGVYEECYNRYADTIQIIVQERHSSENKFVLNGALSFTVYLTDKEIQSLGTNYLLSSNNLHDNSFELIATNGFHSVYAVD